MKKMLTLMELQVILGETLLKTLDKDLTSDERASELATAASVYAGARNLTHNAATIIRAKEVIASGKVKDVAAIKALVGDEK